MKRNTKTNLEKITRTTYIFIAIITLFYLVYSIKYPGNSTSKSIYKQYISQNNYGGIELDKVLDKINNKYHNSVIFYDDRLSFFLETWHIGKRVISGKYYFPMYYFNNKILSEIPTTYHIFFLFTTNKTKRDKEIKNKEEINEYYHTMQEWIKSQKIKKVYYINKSKKTFFIIYQLR